MTLFFMLRAQGGPFIDYPTDPPKNYRHHRRSKSRARRLNGLAYKSYVNPWGHYKVLL